MQRRWLLVTFIVLLLLGGGALTLLSPRDERDRLNMSVPQAALLGLVEGVTEFLPISSTGHLLIVQRAAGIGSGSAESKRAADAFAICIQAGAILAVAGLYLSRLRQVGRGLRGRDAAGRSLAVNLAIAFVPAAIVGLTAGEWIRQNLFGPWPVVWAWGLGGLAILLVAHLKGEATEEGRAGIDLERLTWQAALVIGLAQCVAMWPGVSRSLVTIVGGVLVGLSLRAAVEFSFLLGLLTLTAATAYDVLQNGHLLLATYSPLAMVVGAVFALISAILAVRWMVRYLGRHGLQLFGWYRIALALLTGALLLGGAL